ncbi:MAG: Holliday junction branch migration protein RuvA [Bacteroidales bacterium]|nr:Holliday junction branch migration protein RuvA [Bacteroidales bacterium]MDD4770280.1 Holliday junction branch migration protein RuvA [Bacteroidales bacterium]
MIAYITGKIADLNPTTVILENGGIGYEVFITLNTYTDIRTLETCRLHIYEILREDTHVLYGFYTREERQVFTQLIGVSGVGANTARMILSSLNVEEFQICVAGGDVQALKSVKGIGSKTAERILVDLKDKMTKMQLGENAVLGSKAHRNEQVRNEALAALQMLGFPTGISQKAVTKLLSEQPDLPVEKVVKAALKML